jgi:hypothetical protein
VPTHQPTPPHPTPPHPPQVFVKECCRALVACIGSEEDEVIGRIAIAGAGSLILKALKRHPESDLFSTHAFHLLYYLSSDVGLVQRLISNDVLDALSTNLEAHAGYEKMAEWGCRTGNDTAHHIVHVVLVYDRQV